MDIDRARPSRVLDSEGNQSVCVEYRSSLAGVISPHTVICWRVLSGALSAQPIALRVRKTRGLGGHRYWRLGGGCFKLGGCFGPSRMVGSVRQLSRCLLRLSRFTGSAGGADKKAGSLKMAKKRPNQSMKPTAPLWYNFSVLATTPCRDLSLSR